MMDKEHKVLLYAVLLVVLGSMAVYANYSHIYSEWMDVTELPLWMATTLAIMIGISAIIGMIALDISLGVRMVALFVCTGLASASNLIFTSLSGLWLIGFLLVLGAVLTINETIRYYRKTK